MVPLALGGAIILVKLHHTRNTQHTQHIDTALAIHAALASAQVVLIGCCTGTKNAEPTHRPSSIKRVLADDAKSE